MDALLFAFLEGASAYLPAVKVQGCQSAAEDRDADGVEPAGDGFPEVSLAPHPASFHGAVTVPVPVEIAVDAFFAAGYKGSDKVPVGVHDRETGFLHRPAAFRAHKGRIVPVVLPEGRRLAVPEGCPAVSGDAACSLADGIVAGEMHGEYLGGDDAVPDLDYGRSFHVSHSL